MDSQSAGVIVPVGAIVRAANGESLGRVHTVHPHYFLVENAASSPPTDLEVPIVAVAESDGSRVTLRVNREALTEVPNEHQAIAHRLGQEQ